ncbi:DUF4123 domain-containing protein [Vogesella sp. AC12]|uniref:DUF4123 domain-containing protein n=1 Tax=Vogesella sp. AC12 TaxID=2950550 RepID=UPI0021087D81|nr:DUF4123 domain-containing protein [Vogesella sp. AC12]MCQ4145420.1 DUF4123 domain-containing protein [Vogesella sp. AC12]
MDMSRSALPAEVFSSGAQGWYLLLDRTQGNPLAVEEDLVVPIEAAIVLEDAFFSHEPERAPLLIDLSVLPGMTAEQKRFWAKLGVDGIRQSLIQGGNTMVAGWLYSMQPAGQVLHHLRRLFAQPHPDGQVHHLRYYDPRITRLLDEGLPAAQRNQLLGPIDAWWYADYSGEYCCMHHDSQWPRSGHLVLAPEDWQALDLAAPYHHLLRCLNGLHELYPMAVALDELPEFAQACALLRQAAALPWVASQDDMVGCTLLWLLLGRDCRERYPEVAAELQQYQQDRSPTLTEWLLFAGAEFWAKPIRWPVADKTRGVIA